MFWSFAMAGPMTPAQAVGDFETVVDSLERMYIRPEKIEADTFQDQIPSIRMQLATVENTRDFWLAASKLVASLDDAHTYLVPPLYTEGSARRVAIDVDLREGHTFLVGEDGIPKDPIRILKIGDEDADAVMERWLEHFPGEQRAFEETWIEDDFEHLYPWWTDAESLLLSLEDGSTRTVSVKGVGTATRRTEAPWSYEMKGELMVLRIASFQMDEKSWKKGLKSFFNELEETPPKALVIDVQGNRGGSVARVEELLACLVPSWRVYSSAQVREPQRDGTWSLPEPTAIDNGKGKPAYDGPVYVLTDTKTFATGADLATALSDLGRATIVGEAPGGMPTSTGKLVEVPLPSGQVLYIATAAYVRANPERGDGPLQVDLPSTSDEALPAIREHLRTR